MKHKKLLLVLFAGMCLNIFAQQTGMRFVAIDQNGQQQVFLLENYPRLTFQLQNGATTFTIKDIRSIVMSGVKTCIFTKSDNPCSIETIRSGEVEDNNLPNTQNANNVNGAGSTVKVMENGILYILRNGVRYDALGKRIN